MSDDELLALMLAVDPQTKRVPPGIRAIADAIVAAERERCAKIAESFDGNVDLACVMADAIRKGRAHVSWLENDEPAQVVGGTYTDVDAMVLDMRQYRNHFCTVPGCTDFDACRALVAAGLMTEHPGSVLTGGDALFTVTSQGASAVAAHMMLFLERNNEFLTCRQRRFTNRSQRW